MKRPRHDTPPLLLCVRKPERLEWNRDQDDVAVAGDLRLAAPEPLPTEVVAVAVGGDAVELNGVSVHVEPIGVAVVVKRIDVDGDPVVVQDLFSLGDPGTDQLRIVLGDEGDIQVLVVVGEVGRRRLRYRGAVLGVHLAEIRDHRLRLARLAGQEVAQFRCPADLGDCDGRRSVRLDLAGRSRGYQE